MDGSQDVLGMHSDLRDYQRSIIQECIGRALHVPGAVDNPAHCLLPQTEHIFHPDRWPGACLQYDQRCRIHLRVCPTLLCTIFRVSLACSDRDAKQKWAANAAGWSMGIGGIGGQLLSGVVKNSVGRVFR